MSEVQVISSRALQRSLQPGVSKHGKVRKNSVSANLPKDIADLLATFLDNIKEVSEIKDKLPDPNAATEHEQFIRAVMQSSLSLRKASTTAFNSAEQRLYQSHVSLAVVSDVGRMVFQTKVAVSPEHLSQFIALSTAKPPPLALARKLKSVYEKMQRIRVSIDQASSLAEDVERRRLAPRFDNYTSADINALLTDIDNQFVLVQRMITFLQSEFATIPSRGPNPEKDDLVYSEECVSLEYALVGLNIGNQSDTDAQVNSCDAYEDLQCSTPRVTKAPVQWESASRTTTNSTKPASSPWDRLRSSIKQAKRPNFSFELYDQMTEASLNAKTTPDSTSSPAKRGQAFRQFSSVYRQLRSSNNTSAVHNDLVEEAAAAAITQFSSPSSKTSLTRAEKGPVPFVTSPNWQLAANSPGDWRHIRGATGSIQQEAQKGARLAAEKTPVVAGFSADYKSPLVGLLDHINKYAERQPKLPPPAAPSTLPSAAITAPKMSSMPKPSPFGEANDLSVRRERGSNVSDSPTAPKSRSASQDFTKPTFPAALGMFGSTAPSTTASGVEKLNFGSKSTDRGDREDEGDSSLARKKSVGSNAPTLLTPTSTGSPSRAGGSSSVAQSSPGGAVATPQTVPEIAVALREIYLKYVPEKLADVPKLLTKYAGREKELLEKAIKKYGPLVAPVSSTTQVSSPSAAVSGLPPTSPSGVRPRQGSGSIGGADEQPRSRGASIVSAGTSLFGGAGAKPISTGFGSATVSAGAPGVAATIPATGSVFGGASTGGSLFAKPAAPVTAGGTAGTGTPVASPFGTPAAATGAAPGSLFAKPAAAPTSAAPAEDPVLARVTVIYTQHNPSKLAEIPQLMEKYKGRELQLIANLEKKYNVAHVPLPASAAPAPASVFGSGNNAPATSIFGSGSAATQSSTGFGGGSSLFAKPAATATPTPFGNANSAAAPVATASGASPFGTVAAATGIPSPFGQAATSPFGSSAAATTTPSPFGSATPAATGAGSLFGKPASTPSTGFGQQNTSQGTGGLFGGGSAGVGGASSPFANTNNAGSAGTGGLFGSKGVTGNASPSPFANNNNTTPGTGSLFSPAAGPAATGGSPFGSGFNTPLGKSSAPAGGHSIFQQNTNTGLGSMGAMGLGGGSTGIGGTTSPGLFGRPAAAPGGGGSLFGGGGGAAVGGTGFGGAPAAPGGSLFGGGGGGAAPAITSLSNINQIQQRVQAIYTQHNPSKLAEIPQLMEKYRGRELQLIANLEKKYNIDSSGGNGGGGGGAMMTNGGGQSTGFGSFSGTTNNSGMSTGFGQTQSGTGGLFGGGGGATSTGFGGIAQNNATTSPGGGSLFGRPSGIGAAGGTGGGSLFGGGGGMSAGIAGGGMNGMNSGMSGMSGTQTGFGGQPASGGSVFGRSSALGGNNTSTGFGNMGSMGGGGLFGGGGGNTNSMWGNR